MPRDLMMVRVRLRSPPLRTIWSMSQESISDETPTSLCSRSLSPEVRLVKNVVVLLIFKKSMRRVIIDWISGVFPTLIRLVIGSTTTTSGSNWLTALCIDTRCISRPMRRRP